MGEPFSRPPRLPAHRDVGGSDRTYSYGNLLPPCRKTARPGNPYRLVRVEWNRPGTSLARRRAVVAWARRCIRAGLTPHGRTMQGDYHAFIQAAARIDRLRGGLLSGFHPSEAGFAGGCSSAAAREVGAWRLGGGQAVYPREPYCVFDTRS